MSSYYQQSLKALLCSSISSLHSSTYHIPTDYLSVPSLHPWLSSIDSSLRPLLSLCLPSLCCSLFCRYDPTSSRQTQTAACSVHLAAVWTAATLQPYQGSRWHTTAANKLITPLSIESGLKQANFILQSGQHR